MGLTDSYAYFLPVHALYQIVSIKLCHNLELKIQKLNSVSFFELIDSAACIYEFLPTGEKGMAFAANIHLHHVHVLRGARLERLAAGADDRHLMIFGMNVRLHSSFTSLIRKIRLLLYR